MIEVLIYSTLLGILLSLFSFLNLEFHLLTLLLGLEFLMLNIYMYMYMNFIFFDYQMYFIMIFLTMMVCESVLGLSILVSIIRVVGSDNFQSFSLML
uniref:NADH-ubiquinone oxidoreductase chain 4L n=1 Tax=Megalodontes quinquecinctus TaxID=2491145 RepID=A0A3S8V103_9HYME|nr:NADH dehydrogenase subunit 4L [Megalodontes quinquecinctus]